MLALQSNDMFVFSCNPSENTLTGFQEGSVMTQHIFLKDNTGCFMENVLGAKVKVAWNKIKRNGQIGDILKIESVEFHGSMRRGIQ